MIKEFTNEPLTDFTKEENIKKMKEALAKVRKDFGREYDLIIDGQHIKANDKFNSYNPAKKDEVLGIFQKATEKEAELAINAALKRFEEWRYFSTKERALILLRAANIMRKRRFELNATMVYEVGKNWLEADADTAEAIDFLEFYAREAIRYAQDQPLTPYPGEFNELKYIPLGVGIIIPPWNFPLAILCGMTSAAVVTGNTVVLKPASDSPLIAYKFMEVMIEAGIPNGVINYLTGPGSIAGNYLVAHPKTRFIAFTGSKEVGLKIVELAGKTQPGQIWIKRVIAEMGGKDFIIIDNEADLVDALPGVIASAYGFQGQKCSACSRLIIHQDVYDQFVKMLVDTAATIKIGPPEYQENYLGPVINANAFSSIMNYIEIGKKEGKLVLGGKQSALANEGYFIEPTIFIDVSPDARIAQEEIFGPVLAVIKARDFEEAIRIANHTEYGLTGAFYSKNRQKIAQAKRLLHCGNLYINRKCTGALVGVHPFGGFNMSGTDSKAGGRDYLALFLQAKSISERL
ncbi:MAG: L-glutamate gamma-semialdehyde dehydrogenase [candidate division WOR-3 bacterium]|nr:L-glutamate gamma-semialdehyde dehydrogenase [candidate division WOR-3 bacterium]MCX7757586.1 L-glutamate gamma-semialdehyde dehydrogenase [candidate division WOR-3 bacterium]MDW7987615.1 L-glutamate gamma-semialdehyde dehydrogenase [candidate division WOR-3 bacterium]